MSIEEATLLEFDEAEIIAHCLWAMTFHGFTQSKIQNFADSLKQQAEAIKNMTPEEQAANLITAEELLERFKNNEI